ncbi:translation initiation factor SUI1 [Phlebopus sp. FC_14]|nr:translation initiation factor SUI1 [Phlebopus sp. FC_14]
MNVQNLNSFDPFADEADPLGGNQDVGSQKNYLHIRIQQRNGRKTLTTLQGLPKEYDPKKLLKAFKKEFACNGNLVDDEEMGQVIQLQGDQRVKIANFLTEEGIPKNTIKLHGF